jgi:hypothetical protein
VPSTPVKESPKAHTPSPGKKKAEPSSAQPDVSERDTRSEKQRSFVFDPTQKSLDERIREGSMETRSRRGAVSAENVVPEHTAASARAAFESRLNQASAGEPKDPATRAMLMRAIQKSILFSGMSDPQKEMIIDVSVMRRKHTTGAAQRRTHAAQKSAGS